MSGHKRVDFNEARALLEKSLKIILDAPHAEHFGAFCPVCGLVTATQMFVRDWKHAPAGGTDSGEETEA